MYRTSRDYRFIGGVEKSPLHRRRQFNGSPSASKLNYYPPPVRRGSINDLIEKFEVPAPVAVPIVPVRSKSQIESGFPYRYVRQMSGSSDVSSSHYDQVYYDTTDNEEGSVEEVKRDDHDADEIVARSLAMRALLPLWLLVKPILEVVTIAPLPLFFSFTGMGIFALLVTFIMPRGLCQMLLYPGFRLVCGTLYPAYASYKAVRTKSVKDYVKWMMYWIVFAFFTCIETFTDIFLSWFPFYYEIKIILVLWLLSPATKGSSTLYRKFVHPQLTRREPEIDEYINQAKEKGYTAIYQLGSKSVNYATNIIMQTAIKAINLSQDKALMPPPPSMPTVNGANKRSSRDAIDAALFAHEHTTERIQMTRAYSIDSGLSDPNPVHIDAYDTVMYEIESDAEAQEFLLGTESDTGSSARARGVTGRKTKPKRKAATGRTVKATTKISVPKARRGIRKESVDIDVENDC